MRSISMTRFWAPLVVASCLLAAPRGAAQETFELDGDGWRLQEAPPPDSPAGQLQTIRKRLAEGKPKEALKLAEQWQEDHPNDPLLVEARLLEGDAKSAMGSYYAALFDYEYVARVYPATEQFRTALEREYEIARLFTSGMKRKFLGMRLLPAEGEGAELLIRIQERAPGSEIGERASLTLANYYFEDGRMTLASDAYDLFLLNYPSSTQREWAMLRLIQANLARFKGPAFDPTGLIEALERLKMYQAEFPAAAERIGAEALLIRINASLALKDLNTARWYDTRGEDISAAYLYRRIIEEHPETPAAQQAIARLAKLPIPVVQKTANIPIAPPPRDQAIDLNDPANRDELRPVEEARERRGGLTPAQEGELLDTVRDIEGDDIDTTEGGDPAMTPEIDTFREEEKDE